jgi:hypothetical protein
MPIGSSLTARESGKHLWADKSAAGDISWHEAVGPDRSEFGVLA